MSGAGKVVGGILRRRPCFFFVDANATEPRGVRMSTAIRSKIIAIVTTTIAAFAQPALAQGVRETPGSAAQPHLPSPLAITVDESSELRSPRPLSRNEEIAIRPMDQFKECEHCPEMVVVPAGQFMMGARDVEVGSSSDERPQHKVYFAQPFSVGRFPLTFNEWDSCVAARGCSYRPSDRGSARGSQPVIDILWDDAKEYVAWLSHITGKTYRLLSESEREYVTRAGTITAYWWGDFFDPAQANCAAGKRELSPASTGDVPQAIAGPLPVQSFAPNPWGLYQVHGNVYDWVEDCWNDSYDGAPSDGSAWMSGNCDGHVLRGGAFSRDAQTARSAARVWFGFPNRMIYMSVRVARTFGQ
jgi:formylglycine-generating enzyme required for sulfatase activity